MISVSIFALRDVIRGVQLDSKIPFNGKSHTNPSTATDVQRIRDHLETNKIQMFWPERENNDCAVPVRDLMKAEAAYANTARAFETFRADTRKPSNLGTKHGGTAASAESDGVEEEGANFDNYGEDLELDLWDLALASEEFPAGIDPTDFVAMAREALAAMDDLQLDENVM
jgi:hypothetical protein